MSFQNQSTEVTSWEELLNNKCLLWSAYSASAAVPERTQTHIHARRRDF